MVSGDSPPYKSIVEHHGAHTVRDNVVELAGNAGPLGSDGLGGK